MPIFRNNGDQHYFAHVPKCGGQSIENYLEGRFGTLGFIDNQFSHSPRKMRWLKSSPQHCTADDLAQLFPSDWFASSFALVRHPLERLVSAYNFQSTTWRHVPVGMSIEEWFDEYLDLVKISPFYQDNHLRPQTDFVPKDAAVFKLEDGFSAVVAYLDKLTGTGSPDISVEHLNPTRPALSNYYEERALSPAFIEKLNGFYRADFERFGYDTAQAKNLVAHVPVGKGPYSEENKRHPRGKSLFLRRAWRRVVRITGIPIAMT